MSTVFDKQNRANKLLATALDAFPVERLGYALQRVSDFVERAKNTATRKNADLENLSVFELTQKGELAANARSIFRLKGDSEGEQKANSEWLRIYNYKAAVEEKADFDTNVAIAIRNCNSDGGHLVHPYKTRLVAIVQWLVKLEGHETPRTIQAKKTLMALHNKRGESQEADLLQKEIAVTENRMQLAKVRSRVEPICLGLQELRLPTLILLEILDFTLEESVDVRMAAKWDMIVTYRHFEPRPIPVPNSVSLSTPNPPTPLPQDDFEQLVGCALDAAKAQIVKDLKKTMQNKNKRSLAGGTADTKKRQNNSL